MYLYELDNYFYGYFENRIAKWSWKEDPDAQFVAGTAGFIPVIYPFSQPIDRRVLGEYQTNDLDKQVGYPFISIDPLSFVFVGEIQYTDESYVVLSGTTVSTLAPPLRYYFPYRVTGVTNNFLDHRILNTLLIEKVFPKQWNQRWFEMNGLRYTLEIDETEEAKDETTGVHQFSAIFKIFINLVMAPIEEDPSIGLIKLNIYNDNYLVPVDIGG